MPKIAAKDSNKNISIAPHGTGKVVVGTGAADATVQSDGDYNLILQTGNAVATGKIEIVRGENGNIDITPNGTGEVDIPKVDIDGGAVDGVTLGTNSAVTEAQIDNINIDGNAITSTNDNGNIDLTPNGTGEVNISKVDIDSGAIDGTTIATSDVTVGSGKTLDVSAGSLTTSTAQKQAIIDGAAILPSGTKLLFQQTAAPTGWTKDTTHNDKALRLTSGTVGTGGSVAFETAFASVTPEITNDEVTLSVAQTPSHRHTSIYGGLYPSGQGTLVGTGWYYDVSASQRYTDYIGGGGSHIHNNTMGAINLDVNFVDVIIATKD